MIIDPGSIGIDVSKHHLDVFDGLHGRVVRIVNAPAAIAQLVEGLAGREVFVVFEATARFDRHLREALMQAGVRHARVNPGRARHFAGALGLLAKTDAIDARMLAAMGQALRPAPEEVRAGAQEAARRRLAVLHRRRDQLVAMRQVERQRLSDCEPDEETSLKRHLAWLDEEIAATEAETASALRRDGATAKLYRLLMSVPGIGPVAATTLIALMPELGTRSSRAMAALAGLAPFNVDSGRFRGMRTIRGGRKRVRDALYMAAIGARRTRTPLGAFARQLLDRGKPFKVTMIALARKILTVANAVVRANAAYAT